MFFFGTRGFPGPTGVTALALDMLRISEAHRRLLDQLPDAIPDFDPNAPEHLQRIFGLGLFALLVQAASKSGGKGPSDLIAELAAAAREIVEETGV